MAEMEELPAPMAEVAVSWAVAGVAPQEQERSERGEETAAPDAVEVSSPADDGSSRGCDIPQGEAAGQTAPERGVLGQAAGFLEALLPVGGWLQGLEREEAQAAAVGLLSQMGHHLVQSLEAARRSAETEALVGRLQEELRQEKEGRAELLEQIDYHKETLREARETIMRRDAAVAAVSHERGELQRLMERMERREAVLRQASGEAGRRHGLPEEGASASAKRKRTMEPGPLGVIRVGEKSSLRIHLRAAEKGAEVLERRLEEEMGASSVLRQQLEDERSRSVAAEGRAAELGRNISRFGASLELPLAEAALRAAFAEVAEGPEGPGDGVGGAETGPAGGSPGPAM